MLAEAMLIVLTVKQLEFAKRLLGRIEQNRIREQRARAHPEMPVI